MNTHAVLLVVDSAERDRINVVKKELKLLLAHEDLAKACILVFANKQDVKGAMTPAELSTALELHDIKGRAWHIQGCCALTGEGLTTGLDWVAQTLSS